MSEVKIDVQQLKEVVVEIEKLLVDIADIDSKYLKDVDNKLSGLRSEFTDNLQDTLRYLTLEKSPELIEQIKKLQTSIGSIAKEYSLLDDQMSSETKSNVRN